MSPVLFQELVPKRDDVRVIAMVRKIFSFMIHSQDNDHSKFDFRAVAPNI